MADEQTKKPKKARRAGQIITRGDKTHLVRVFLGRDANGKRQYFNKTIKGRKDADAWLTGALRRLSLGESIEDTNLSFSAWLGEWLKLKEQSLRPRSLEIYTDIVDRYVKPVLGERRLSAIVAGDIQQFYTRLLNEQKLSGRSVDLVHRVLTNCFRQALKLDLIRKSPMLAVEVPRYERKEMKALTAEQARAFLQAADAGEHGCWLAFLLTTGCRPGESQALKWADLNWQNGTATIQRNLVRLRKGKWEFGEPKTARGKRTIPLPQNLLKRLTDHRRRQQEQRLKAGATWQNYDLIFCNEIGEPYPHDYLPWLWKETLKKAGLPTYFRSYDARHTSATLLMGEGTSPKVVSERLGHANVNITLEVYSHVLPNMQNEATEKLDKLTFG